LARSWRGSGSSLIIAEYIGTNGLGTMGPCIGVGDFRDMMNWAVDRSEHGAIVMTALAVVSYDEYCTVLHTASLPKESFMYGTCEHNARARAYPTCVVPVIIPSLFKKPLSKRPRSTTSR